MEQGRFCPACAFPWCGHAFASLANLCRGRRPCIARMRTRHGSLPGPCARRGLLPCGARDRGAGRHGPTLHGLVPSGSSRRRVSRSPWQTRHGQDPRGRRKDPARALRSRCAAALRRIWSVRTHRVPDACATGPRVYRDSRWRARAPSERAQSWGVDQRPRHHRRMRWPCHRRRDAAVSVLGRGATRPHHHYRVMHTPVLAAAQAPTATGT